ncbi:rRNA methyltransferase [Chlorella sorokiniana]|uniref:rRNA methyltransferase n=1 Tax=Chlorella sorokiniana TaxID=3076 RepID=A0A2P6TNN0_CHLSO|nr:rRNA methyltransferase [Chlorella sorokiniana]|eukprot:PRW50932.1 rRNA methyltransferase [Chlorella sorokiniana]
MLRVAENFEAHDVVVVDPRCDARCDEVAVTSCFSPLLHRLRVVPSLADALADCTGSIGFTRRAGGGRLVHASMRQLLGRFPAAIPALLLPPSGLQQLADSAGPEAAQASDEAASSSEANNPASAAAAAAAATGAVALVFGREESGLLESELLLCSHACAIPTGRTQPSLNLSHAVAVIVSQLFDLQQQRLMAECLEDELQKAELQQEEQQQQAGQQTAQPAVQQGQQQQAAAATLLSGSLLSGSLFESERVRWQREQALASASQAELEALLQRAAALLEGAGISAKESIGGGDKSNHGRRKQLMGHVRSLLLRSQASTAEVRALHGLCKELERRQRQREEAQQRHAEEQQQRQM